MVRVGLLSLTLSSVAALILVSCVMAASPSVKITESNNRYMFGPAKVFVNVGQAVTWTNGSDAPHTVTSDSGSELASSDVSAAGTFSHTFNSTGTFAYHCTIHTYMKASVVVLAAGVTPPASDTVEPSAASPTSPAGMFVALALVAGSILTRLYLRFRRA